MNDINRPSGDAAPPPLVFLGSAFSPGQTRMLLFGLALATGMEFYTFDSMNLVLVDIAGTLGVSGDEASWLLTIYSCSLFLGVPVSTWLAGHVGYKRFLLSTITLFAVASIGCSVSPSLKIMLLWRAVQGAAGAGLLIWWRSSIYLIFPREKRSPSLMRVSTGLYLASAAGLLVSGYVTDHYNWRLIFLPNIVLAAGAIWFLWRTFPEMPPEKSERLRNTDWLGLSLLAAWTICLQIVLSRGNIDDWLGSPHIRFLSWASAVTFAGFVYWQMSPSNRYPLVDIPLITNRHVMASVLIGIFTGMILSGSLFVLPEFLRNTDSQTHSATQTGRLICIYALTAAAIRPFVPVMIARTGPRRTIAIAIGILIASMLLLNHWLTTGTSDGYYVVALVLYAFCLAPLLPAVGGGTVARIGQSQLLDGVSLYMTFRQFGASLGVALLTILIQRRETLHSSRLFDHVRQASIQTQIRLAGLDNYLASHLGHGFTDAHGAAVALLRGAGAKQATTLSNADAFLFMALVGLIALFFIPLVPPVVGGPSAQKSKPEISPHPAAGAAASLTTPSIIRTIS
jgi:MFS transporter, DHA2 family, multidrug resistance protein